MSHLKLFGSVAYRNVPYQLRNKLDDNGEQIILVWYHSMGGYKLYDAINKRLIISRDVIFDELREWQHVVTDYQTAITAYNRVRNVLAVFERAETVASEVQVEENVTRSTWQRGIPTRL